MPYSQAMDPHSDNWLDQYSTLQELSPHLATEVETPVNYVYDHQATQSFPATLSPYDRSLMLQSNGAVWSTNSGWPSATSLFTTEDFNVSPFSMGADPIWSNDTTWMTTNNQSNIVSYPDRNWGLDNGTPLSAWPEQMSAFTPWILSTPEPAHYNPFAQKPLVSVPPIAQSLPIIKSTASGTAFKEFVCKWPSCPVSNGFSGMKALENHVTDVHIVAVLAAWPGCKWPDCKSRGNFKTSKLLEDHVQNIHIDPLHCTERGCSYKNAFGKQGDLERHIKTKHRAGQLPHRCPFASCPRTVKQFARKDKLKEHVQNWHGHFKCPESGCSRGNDNGFRTEERLLRHTLNIHAKTGCPFSHCHSSNTLAAQDKNLLEEHIEAMHGDYECEIGSCKEGELSRLIPHTLKIHLCTDHHLDFIKATLAVERLVKEGQLGLKETHIEDSDPEHNSTTSLLDCDVCKARDGE